MPSLLWSRVSIVSNRSPAQPNFSLHRKHKPIAGRLPIRKQRPRELALLNRVIWRVLYKRWQCFAVRSSRDHIQSSRCKNSSKIYRAHPLQNFSGDCPLSWCNDVKSLGRVMSGHIGLLAMAGCPWNARQCLKKALATYSILCGYRVAPAEPA